MTEPGVSPTAARWRWTALLCALGAATALAAQLHGQGARRYFEPPPEMAGVRWGFVTDAGAAVRVWDAAQVSGRPLVVFTGRWSTVPGDLVERILSERPGATMETLVDQENALLVAARTGIGRAFTVLMPQAAWDRRVAELQGARELVVEGGCAWLAFAAIERAFCLPASAPGMTEPALVLVEPSWFDAPEAPTPAALLFERGIPFDLALLAASDPVASEGARARLLEFGGAVRAANLEVGE